MHRFGLSILCLMMTFGCGVYLDFPSEGNNSQWRLLTYTDTAVFHLPKYAPIDSVVNLKGKTVYYPRTAKYFRLPASELQPGINEVSYIFYSNGKKRRSFERLYMVSDIEPRQLTVDDYLLLKHDEDAFTQGLLWKDGYLYETTGLIGESSLRILNPKNGDIIRNLPLDKQIFAEGFSWRSGEFIMLTWKDGLIYKFDAELEQIGVFPYKHEGWGLTTTDDNVLLTSDGTYSLHYLDENFKVDSTFQVYNNRGPVHYLNELEYIEGKVWANVLGSDIVQVIELTNGKVLMEIDLSACIDRHRYKQAGVLNGIAYNPHDKLVYFTGKNWPYIVVWRPLFFDK
ncbi:glutaminyl-peptide cyclotransferase [Carboxylicivirga mesophila]|nr:glutaminyl-peptide cyclotransferase [Carboxylicivirga mesophila]